MKRIFLSLLVSAAFLIQAVNARPHCINAQDMISLRDRNTGGIIQLKGHVIDWDAQRVVYDSNGREREIPSRQVVDISYPRSDAQVDGDTYFESGKLAQALQAYENAIETEQRDWIKRDIRARRLQCAAGLGQIEIAFDEFFKILRSAEQTRHFHLIPLAWQKREISPDTQTLLRNWCR